MRGIFGILDEDVPGNAGYPVDGPAAAGMRRLSIIGLDGAQRSLAGETERRRGRQVAGRQAAIVTARRLSGLAREDIVGRVAAAGAR